MGRGGILRKRGMSPLIATVLLMAFAVALGGMIMNWKVDITSNDECELMRTITVTQFCSMDSSVRLRMQAGPDTPSLQRIQLRLTANEIEQVVSVKNAQLEKNSPLELSIPVTLSGDTAVDLLGVVGPNAEPFICVQHPIERVDPIRPC